MNRYLILLLWLVGCSTTEPHADFNSDLYSGVPVASLASGEPPKNESEAITRGDRALSNQQFDLALYEYLRSLSFPDAEYKEHTFYTVGQIHLARENYVLAEKSFQASVGEDPNHIGSLQALGTLYTKRGERQQGQQYYLNALNADQQRLGRDVKTRLSPQSLSTYLVDHQSPTEAYAGLGILYDLEQQHAFAQRLFDKALKINPRDVKALIGLGYSYYMSGELNKAVYFTQAALKQSPNQEQAINNLALIAIAQDQPQQALSIFRRHMSEEKALNNVGYFLILNGKPDEAIPYLQRAIDTKPSYYELANKNLVRALSLIRKNGDTSRAVITTPK
ncbi:hypothetical protein BS333_10670 [Vibrio azureus]|uniref:TadD protein n=2 Tax=Vibrio azureus TaxID=512649 RepID=U3BYN2_9VIBR|nr:hypothetical protein BS333_10670 [Vibrio azureus]GAD74404.1 hypothetical protein VAZ01S_010_00570 [Vibrio azureus NBRC 104587]